MLHDLTDINHRLFILSLAAHTLDHPRCRAAHRLAHATAVRIVAIAGRHAAIIRAHQLVVRIVATCLATIVRQVADQIVRHATTRCLQAIVRGRDRERRVIHREGRDAIVHPPIAKAVVDILLRQSRRDFGLIVRLLVFPNARAAIEFVILVIIQAHRVGAGRFVRRHKMIHPCDIAIVLDAAVAIRSIAAVENLDCPTIPRPFLPLPVIAPRTQAHVVQLLPIVVMQIGIQRGRHLIAPMIVVLR